MTGTLICVSLYASLLCYILIIMPPPTMVGGKQYVFGLSAVRQHLFRVRRSLYTVEGSQYEVEWDLIKCFQGQRSFLNVACAVEGYLSMCGVCVDADLLSLLMV